MKFIKRLYVVEQKRISSLVRPFVFMIVVTKMGVLSSRLALFFRFLFF